MSWARPRISTGQASVHGRIGLRGPGQTLPVAALENSACRRIAEDLLIG
jgi:hypothetical protein